MRVTKRTSLFIVHCSLFIALSGCAEINPPGPGQIMRQPLGESPLRIGMTKEKISSLWGKPDVIRVLGVDAQGMVREEWILPYPLQNARLPSCIIG